ncbi:MAG: hypothetical protein ACFHWZ_04470 [Phycisphaerales bacterium]
MSRSRTAGNLSMMMTLIIGLSGLLIGLVMDLEQAPAAVQSLARPVLGLLGIDPTDTDSAFRIFYVFAILAGLIGIWAFSHVRWRGGRAGEDRVPAAGIEREHRRPARDVRRAPR